VRRVDPAEKQSGLAVPSVEMGAGFQNRSGVDRRGCCIAIPTFPAFPAGLPIVVQSAERLKIVRVIAATTTPGVDVMGFCRRTLAARVLTDGAVGDHLARITRHRASYHAGPRYPGHCGLPTRLPAHDDDDRSGTFGDELATARNRAGLPGRGRTHGSDGASGGPIQPVKVGNAPRTSRLRIGADEGDGARNR
jgi:hypothetical protein